MVQKRQQQGISLHIPKKPVYKVRMMSEIVIELNLQCTKGECDQYIIPRMVSTVQDLEDLILDLMNDMPGDPFKHADAWDRTLGRE
jgi:hypothetical protein